MRILLISDILWHKDCLEPFKNTISRIKPSLILFAGDLIDGGLIYENYANELDLWEEFERLLSKLLRFLNEKKVHSFIVKGNKDYPDHLFDRLGVNFENLSYVEEISNRLVEFNNIRILGIPFSFTHKLKYVKRIDEFFLEEADIVLAHSEYVRRIWLLTKLKTKFIVTGHSGRELCQIFDKFLIVTGLFPYDYAILDYESNEQTITYFTTRLLSYNPSYKLKIALDMQNRCVSQAKIIDGRLIWKKDNYGFKNSKYPKMIESLVLAKKQIVNTDEDKQKQIIADLLEKEILRNHIAEYIGKKKLLYGY